MSAPPIGPLVSGPSFGGISSFVNEGPATLGSLENFTPLVPSTPDLGGTLGPMNSDLTAVEALNLTFPIAESRNLENTGFLISEDFSYHPWKMDMVENYPQKGTPFEVDLLEHVMPAIINIPVPEIKIGVAEPLIKPREDEEAEVELIRVRQTIHSLENELKRATQNLEKATVVPQPQIKTETAQPILEITKKREEQKSTAGKDKPSAEISKNRLVKDEKALAQRLQDALIAIKVAFDWVKTKGKGSVSGAEVEAQIPDEYGQVRSEVLKQDEVGDLPDGSYLFEGIDIKQIGSVSSQDQMQPKVVAAVHKNVPVRRAQENGGEPVTEEDVSKVYLFRKNPPIEQVSVKEQNPG